MPSSLRTSCAIRSGSAPGKRAATSAHTSSIELRTGCRFSQMHAPVRLSPKYVSCDGEKRTPPSGSALYTMVGLALGSMSRLALLFSRGLAVLASVLEMAMFSSVADGPLSGLGVPHLAARGRAPGMPRYAPESQPDGKAQVVDPATDARHALYRRNASHRRCGTI